MLLLGDILRRHAATRGEKLAYVLGEARVSYRAMNSQANRIAHLLRARGVGRGDRVAILAGNIPLYPECYFAAAKLGAILVPVNARYKEAEVEYALTQSESKALLFSSEFAAMVDVLRANLAGIESFLSLDGKPTRVADHLPDLLSTAPDDEPQIHVDENEPHVMLYTSGTTGNPKGVLCSHRSYVLAAAQSQSGLRLGEEDIGVSMFPMFHMGGWALPLGLWWSGATVVIMPKADPEEILGAIERERATYFYGIPTVFLWMLESPRFGSFDLSSLRLVASGTSAMTEEQVLGIHQGFPGAAMIIIYGSTEAGQVTMLRPPDVLRKPTSVGRPALNVDVRLLDGGGNEVGNGQAGEIVCRSDFLMLGYWRMPGATREVLRDGWYSTGDLAARDDDGFLYITGRVKEMIKTGGENVFPAEVEAVLFTHPGVRDAAVFGVPDAVWGESVVAAVVRSQEDSVSAEEVIAHVAARLAGYKKPRRIFFVDELPRTAATGRVQRPLLRERFLVALSRP